MKDGEDVGKKDTKGENSSRTLKMDRENLKKEEGAREWGGEKDREKKQKHTKHMIRDEEGRKG